MRKPTVNWEWDDEQLEEAGLDKAKVASIARRFARVVEDMEKIGLRCYLNNDNASLYQAGRHPNGDDGKDQSLVIVHIGTGGTWDGGDW